MLKSFKLGKFTLISALVALIFAAVVGTAGLFFLHSSDVEKLVKYYPIFNNKINKYELVLNRPSNWVNIDKISKYSKWAIVVSEDWAFYDHTGFDFQQIRIVVGESIKEGRLVRGASTITQQVVKNLILSSERTLWRKLRELILSYKVTKLLSKDKVLEIYLNMVELGDGIYGIGKASNFYFNKDPSRLTAREGAFLAMLLPSPKRYASSFKMKKVTPFAKATMQSILVKLRQANIYDEDQRILESQKLFYWEKKEISNEEYLEYNYFE